MGKAHAPRHGSMMVSPRVRAKRIYPRVCSKKETTDAKAVEFAGYKVGMAHVKIIDDKKGSATHNQEIVVPATVIETPPLMATGIRAYRREAYGLKAAHEAIMAVPEKDTKKKAKEGKKKKDTQKEIEAIEKNIDKYERIVIIVHTQPEKAGIHKKKPEVFELDIGGSPGEALAYAKENLGKEIKIEDVLKAGSLVDAVAVTKGFGWQGSIKRFGVRLLPKKSQKLRRKAANLGGFHPHKVKRTVPQMGQMGYHKRTDYNKRIILISDKPEEINGNGWIRYGLVNSTYILIKGSVPGPTKRLVRIRTALRAKNGELPVPQVISTHVR